MKKRSLELPLVPNYCHHEEELLGNNVIYFYEKSKKRKLFLFIAFFFLFFLIDFVSKEYVSKNLKRDENEKNFLQENEVRAFFNLEQKFFVLKSFDIIPNYFSLFYVRNFDIGFSTLNPIRGFFSEKGFFYFVVGLQSMVLVMLLFTFGPYLYDFFWPFTLIFAGGFSNVFDRLLRGYVVDFFRFQFPDFLNFLNPWPIFNFADIFISIGAFYLIYMHFTNQNDVFFLEREKY